MYDAVKAQVKKVSFVYFWFNVFS